METSSKFDRNTNVDSFADEIIAFSKLKRNRKKIKIGNLSFSKEDIKALSDEVNSSENALGIRASIALSDDNQIKLFLEVMYKPGVGPVPGPGVGTSPK